ncbi:MAG TPA: ATP-binding cassette domain-containing protein [Rubrivivax sp.]|nr:ATP-binding cassette domain-containing protein [Rubrivivax sp.]
MNPPLLQVDGLCVSYAVGGGQRMRAVDGVSFDIARGETLALVGESGCGKSSVARAVMQLAPASGGDIVLEGRSLARLSRGGLAPLRRRFQMIFQDPISSLNPRRRVRDILAAPLKVNGLYDGAGSQARIREVLEIVGLDPAAALDRFAHEFSGGQCQRISIARALILEPLLLVCDEPVSALDVSVRAQVLNVLNGLRERPGLAMLFISHDLAVVRNVADRVAVMYLGRIVEIGDAGAVMQRPAHPYTAALLSAVPIADPDAPALRIALAGEMPSPMALPSGCRFRSRCPSAQPRCAAEEPPLAPAEAGAAARRIACHFPFSVSASGPASAGAAPGIAPSRSPGRSTPEEQT